MKFCTAINCMDGRIQLPVIDYLCNRFDVTYVDMITEPGPNGILSSSNDNFLIQSIINRITISVERHKSVGIAIVGHYDCAGNPNPKAQQDVQTNNAMNVIKQKFNVIEIIGLWVNETWKVEEIGTFQ